MLIMVHSVITKGNLEDWRKHVDSKQSVRAQFTNGESMGYTSDNQIIGYADVHNWEGLLAHLQEPAERAHQEKYGEIAKLYRLYEDLPETDDFKAFGHFTFLNLSATEWIDAWMSDEKRLSSNELFAVVDEQNVSVFCDIRGGTKAIAQHVARPEVKTHIERCQETSKAWRVEEFQAW
jgi:hypothetical protein